jgi:hypothetical protein
MIRVRKKILWGIVAAFALLVALLVALQFLAPRLINQESVKNNIEAIVSKGLGGKLVYDRLDYFILPSPGIRLRGPNISIPGRMTGTLNFLDIYLEWLPLFTGKIRIADVILERPEFTFAIPGKTETRPAPAIEKSPKDNPMVILAAAASGMPNLSIQIKEGGLTFTEDERKLVSLRDVDTVMAFEPPMTQGGGEGVSLGQSFRITGNFRGTLTEESLPGPVRITVERFEVSPQTISMTETRTQFLDASFDLSGRIDDYLTLDRKVDLTLNGTLGPNTMHWIITAASLPSELTVQTPLVFSRTHLQWERGKMMRVAGTAVVGQGPSVSYEVLQGSDRFAVKELRIQDKGSKAALTMNYENRILDLSFAGNLVPSTLNGFFEHEHFEFGWLQGDFKSRIVLDHPTESTAKGTLTGERLVLPLRKKTPVTIDRISLSAADHTLTLNPIVLAYGSYHHTVKGDLKAMENGWLLDLNSDGLEWEGLQVLILPDATEKEGGESPAPSKPYFPARATLRISTDYFSAGRWTARPARAEILLEPGRIRISMKEAVVCGVNLKGTLTIAPGNLDLDFRPSATHQDLEPNLPCLTGEDLRSTGTFDLSGSFSSHGTGPDLLNNLQGTVTFTAKKGRIYRGGVIVRVLQFLNVTDLLRGSFPDPEQKGVPYDSVTLQGSVKKGFLKFKEMIFVSPLVNIVGNGSINLPDRKLDLTFLVAPLTTTDSVIKKIPLLRDILGGSLITIPVRVKGPFEKLEVDTVPPEAVAEGLVGMMKRTLQAPFKLIEPIIPGTKKKS